MFDILFRGSVVRVAQPSEIRVTESGIEIKLLCASIVGGETSETSSLNSIADEIGEKVLESFPVKKTARQQVNSFYEELLDKNVPMRQIRSALYFKFEGVYSRRTLSECACEFEKSKSKGV